MGYYTTASGDYSTAMGDFTTASGDYSTTMGQYVTAGATNTIVLGQGVNSSVRLENNTASSLMVGFNSTVPTLFVGPSSGTGTTGKVGIATSTPSEKLTVADGGNILAGGGALITPFGGFGRYSNLLKNSEEFNLATCAKTNVTVTADSVAAPNGRTTALYAAETLDATVAGGYIQQSYNTRSVSTGHN